MQSDKALLFYVQDERYVTVPWMAKSGDVQDERYVMVPWMAKSGDVQDERYVTVPWMAKSFDAQNGLSQISCPPRHYFIPARQRYVVIL
jgi:hypothetical protein